MTEDSGESIKLIEEQQIKEEMIAPTIDMKLLVEEMKKTMDKALIEALTPSVTENDSRFFSSPGPVHTPPKKKEQERLDPTLNYLCQAILGLPMDCVIYNQEEVETLLDLTSLSKEDIFDIEGMSGEKIKKIHARKLQQLTWWYIDEASKHPNNQVQDDDWFHKTSEDFENFRREKVPFMSRQDINIKTYKTSDNQDSEALNTWNKNLRLDVSSFPEFKGQLEQWLPYKRKFLATAKTYDLDVLFQENIPTLIPDSQADKLWKKKSEFVYSVFLRKVSGGACLLAMRRNSDSQCARATFFAFVDHFESPENKMVISQKCQSIIEGLELTHTYTGGVNSFVNKLENTYMDLEYCTGSPKSDLDKKTKLLLSIKDTRLFGIRDNFSMNPSLSFNSCLVLLTQHATMFGKSTRNSRQASGRGERGGKGGRNGKGRSGKIPETYKGIKIDQIPDEEWRSLTYEQRQKVIELRREFFANRNASGRGRGNYSGRGGRGTPGRGGRGNPGRGNFGRGGRGNPNRRVQFQGTERELEEEEIPPPQEEEEEHSPSDNVWDNIPTLGDIFATRCVSAMVTSRIAQQKGEINDTKKDEECIIEDVLIDSGADTGCLGKAFKIINEDNFRTINVYGCRDEFVTKGLKVGDGITLVTDSSGEKFILRYNEGIIDQNGRSIFSVAQLRDHGMDVDDRPIKYGGRQQMETMESVVFPLNMKGGLAHLTIQYPTDEEISSYPVLEITSDLPWNPEGLEDHNDRTLQEVKTEKHGPDLEQLAPCLGWKPTEVIKRTLEATTQYVKNSLRIPMRRHFKTRNRATYVRRLREIICTDTFFASRPAKDGITCAQMYVGKKSGLTQVFGMSSESQFSETLQDFIRKWGAPDVLMSDNAKSETGKKVKKILREYCIKDQQSEAHQQNQNLAESRIGEIKRSTNIMMDRTGTPDDLWYLCMTYVVYLLNHLAVSKLNWKTPIEMATGETPDISNLLQFHWYEKVYYYDHSMSFPDSKEKLGRFVGIAEHVGDTLTYHILTEDISKVISR